MKRTFKKYLSHARCYFNETTAYKIQLLASLLWYPIMLGLFAMLWNIVYTLRGDNLIGGLTLTETLIYFGLVRALIYIRIGKTKTSRVIIRGRLDYELIRPTYYFIKSCLREFVKSLVQFAAALFFFFIISLIFGWKVQTNIFSLILFLISIMLMFLLSYVFAEIMSILTFWFKSDNPFTWLFGGILRFCGGELVPLSMLPLWFATINNYLPFKYMIATPIYIYLNKYPILESLQQVGLQFIWIIILFLILSIIWNKGLKRYDSQGG
ncbi:ABC-2 family transporter protein [Candidatus Woesearchaeota archaeon]|nr:ABC-2 family transporter protein [Candidatus Woesearchaeota archaeon]